MPALFFGGERYVALPDGARRTVSLLASRLKGKGRYAVLISSGAARCQNLNCLKNVTVNLREWVTVTLSGYEYSLLMVLNALLMNDSDLE